MIHVDFFPVKWRIQTLSVILQTLPKYIPLVPDNSVVNFLWLFFFFFCNKTEVPSQITFLDQAVITSYANIA